MKMYSVMLFVLCLNIAAFILNESAAFPTSQALSVNPSDVITQFNWTTLLTSLGTGGAVAGIVALLTRQYVYAAGALLIWSVGALSPLIRWFFIGAPLMLNALLPSELVFISIAVQAFFAIIFFMFIIEIVSQRQIT